MLHISVGHSNDPDSQAAIAEVLEQCWSDFAGVKPKAGLLLAAIDYDYAWILQQIHRAFPGIELIGGTTDGEISSMLGFEQDSLVLMVFCSEQVEIRAGMGRNVAQAPLSAAKQAVERACAGNPSNICTADIQLCLAIPDGITHDSAASLASLKQVLGANIPIVGGTAGDHARYQQTYQFCHTEVESDAIAILLFSGPLRVSYGVASGWQPVGRQGRATKVDGNLVYEIDGQPALAFYHNYLGGLSPSSHYPLAVFDAEGKQFYLRSPLASDAKSGSVSFFGGVPAGAIVQITEASSEKILSAVAASVSQAMNSYTGTQPAAALFFSCEARRHLLGTRAKEEYLIAKSLLPEALPSCGFYAYSELAPLKVQGESQMHNETFVTLVLGT
ncbi:MAG: hypothetical protein F6K19_07615 [Cyanothece sp. SIO1E1]|nr:hypothetical protein [Cyanothece sp. SIO1E1]